MFEVGVLTVSENRQARVVALGDPALKAKPGRYRAFVSAWGAATVEAARQVDRIFQVVVCVSAERALASGALELDAAAAKWTGEAIVSAD
uniref:Uncharacterized protein n=1 Tax=mine drainage metagenome TaxID=410659 RepID=E6QPC0_9ZZZZ